MVTAVNEHCQASGAVFTPLKKSQFALSISCARHRLVRWLPAMVGAPFRPGERRENSTAMTVAMDKVSSQLETGMLEGNGEGPAHRKRSRRYHKCPECDRRTLALIHRRAVDKMTSWFFPVRRYRCRNPECRWEGNLPSSEGRKKVLTFWQMLLWGSVSVLLLTGFWFSLSYLMKADQ